MDRRLITATIDKEGKHMKWYRLYKESEEMDEPKFDIGDKVWYKSIQVTIIDMKPSIKGGFRYQIKETLRPNSTASCWRSGEEIFATKEESEEYERKNNAMKVNRGPISPEDYVEPRCLLCGEPFGAEETVKPVPQQRIIEKMNDYMSKRDYAGAERHLKYWLEEAKVGNDKRGQLMIYNELVGHYRKTGEKENAFSSAENALRLLNELDFEGTISSGTTYTNVATAYNAFGENEKSAELFEKAKKVYESSEKTSPELLGGLYNNMALTLVALGRFDEASALYEKALAVMEKVENGVLEQAITYLNMADAVEASQGAENGESVIFDYLDRAFDLLNSKNVTRDGYYAFVCEKCAPAFSYYGYFSAAKELNERAESIYERA